MKVSVLMPVYKTDRTFLREAIASVLGQTFADFEFLIADDAPDDPREDVVREFDDPRIVYLRNPANLGIAASRNLLIDRARGEYLAVFDHDDVCRRERFAKEVAYLDAHPDCGVVSGWTQPIPSGSVNRYPAGDREIKVEMMRACSVWHPAAMVRKSLLETHGVRYEPGVSPVEDYMLWMRLLPHTRFENLQEVLIDYRLHATNASRVQRRRLLESDARVKAWARANLPDIYGEYELRRECVSRIKLFGVPVLKIRTARLGWEAKLFNVIPLISARRKNLTGDGEL